MYTLLPPWLATTVQIPNRIRAIFVPLALQIVGVLVVNVTTSPEDAVGATVTGDWARNLVRSAGKVIVWPAFVTVKDRVTAVAAV